MTRRTYRYRGRWNRRARNLAKMRDVKLAPCYVCNSWPCRDSKRRYSWVTVNGDVWRYKNVRPMPNAFVMNVVMDILNPQSESRE